LALATLNLINCLTLLESISHSIILALFSTVFQPFSSEIIAYSPSFTCVVQVIWIQVCLDIVSLEFVQIASALYITDNPFITY
jgi:hypothetical protein